MVKRVISVLSLLLVFSLLMTGCGSSTQSNGDKTSAGNESVFGKYKSEQCGT